MPQFLSSATPDTGKIEGGKLGMIFRDPVRLGCLVPGHRWAAAAALPLSRWRRDTFAIVRSNRQYSPDGLGADGDQPSIHDPERRPPILLLVPIC